MEQPASKSSNACEEPGRAAHAKPTGPRPGNSDVLDYICSRLVELGSSSDATAIQSLSIDQVGIDSLELTELVMEIEDRFSVIIDDQDLSGSTTISELASSISVSIGK
jgi:acyl carrier protein